MGNPKLQKKDVTAVSFTKIQTIPEEIVDYPNINAVMILMSPNADWYSISTVLKKIPKLEYLKISMCNMDTFPKSLAKLKSIKYLNINYNKIKNIDEICTLSNLKMLIIGLSGHSNTGNEVKSLPACFCNLKSLKYLYASFNNFTKIPNQVYCLKKLKFISLENKFINNSEMQKRIEYFNKNGRWN